MENNKVKYSEETCYDCFYFSSNPYNVFVGLCILSKFETHSINKSCPEFKSRYEKVDDCNYCSHCDDVCSVYCSIS